MNATIWIIIYCICTYIIAGIGIYIGIKKAKQALAKNQIADVMVTQFLTNKKNDWKKPKVILPIVLLGIGIIPVALPIYAPFFIYGRISSAIKKSKTKKFIISGEPLFWQALDRMDKEAFDDDFKNNFKSQDENDAIIEEHHSSGMWLRNSLGLWNEDNELQKWFLANKIKHPDDMSTVLMRAFHRKLNLVDIDLKGLIATQKEASESGFGI